MKTIFASHRKRLRFPLYFSVFDAGDGVEYQKHYSREDRAKWDLNSSRPRYWYWKGAETRHLYRINVYPKECQ